MCSSKELKHHKPLLLSLMRRAREGDKDKRIFFIDSKSRQERKELFIATIIEGRLLSEGEKKVLRQDILLKKFIQDPYRLDTWPTPYFMNEIAYSQQKKQDVTRLVQAIKLSFEERYALNQKINVNRSMTNPSLFNLGLKNKMSLFRDVLYNREDLVVKITPMYTIRQGMINATVIAPMTDASSLEEIHHDIAIGYFLNELLYGYLHVLSIHFCLIVDWFLTMGVQGHLLDQSQLDNPETAKYCHQVMIMEKANTPLEVFIKERPNVKTIRFIAWQVLHSLWIADYTNKFRHGDLHANNIMLLNVDYTDSPLANKDLYYSKIEMEIDKNDIYKLNEVNAWFRIPKEDMAGYIVKIIDFGKGSMRVPDKREHVYFNEDSEEGTFSSKHVHSNTLSHIQSEGNIRNDINWFILNMIDLVAENQDDFDDTEEEKRELERFYQFAQDVFPLRALKEKLDNNTAYRFFVEQLTGGRELTMKNILPMYDDRILGKVLDEFLHASMKNNHSARLTSALSHDFFSTYRVNMAQKDYTNKEDITQQRENSVVVSFPTSIDDISMESGYPDKEEKPIFYESKGVASSSTLSSLKEESRRRCDVCGFKREGMKTTENNDNICSKVCYEFKYIYNSKTVYR